MAGCECEHWEDEWAFSNIDATLKYEDGVWQELTCEGSSFTALWKIITECPWCHSKLTSPKGGSKLTEEAGTKDHFAGKVQDTLNEMAEEIPTEEAGDES